MRGNVTVFKRNCCIQIERTGSIKGAYIDLFHATRCATLHKAAAAIHAHRIGAIDLRLDRSAHQLVWKVKPLRVVKRLQYHARLGGFGILGSPRVQAIFRLVKRKDERDDQIGVKPYVSCIGTNQAASAEVAGS